MTDVVQRLVSMGFVEAPKFQNETEENHLKRISEWIEKNYGYTISVASVKTNESPQYWRYTMKRDETFSLEKLGFNTPERALISAIKEFIKLTR